MSSDYQEPAIALKYLNFLNSDNGKIQQEVLSQALLQRLATTSKSATVLDAACGSGWLSILLKQRFNKTEACDSSDFLIKLAQSSHRNINFKTASLDRILPYPPASFDVTILNMSAPDLANLDAAFKNLSTTLKPGGCLLATVPNPDYTFPAAEWKRSFWDVVLRKKPGLRPKKVPQSGTKVYREFGQDTRIASHFYTLDNYIKSGQAAGLRFQKTSEIRSQTDSKNFDLNYQLYRYPLLLLMEFIKP